MWRELVLVLVIGFVLGLSVGWSNSEGTPRQKHALEEGLLYETLAQSVDPNPPYPILAIIRKQEGDAFFLSVNKRLPCRFVVGKDLEIQTITPCPSDQQEEQKATPDQLPTEKIDPTLPRPR